MYNWSYLWTVHVLHLSGADPTAKCLHAQRQLDVLRLLYNADLVCVYLPGVTVSLIHLSINTELVRFHLAEQPLVLFSQHRYYSLSTSSPRCTSCWCLYHPFFSYPPFIYHLHLLYSDLFLFLFFPISSSWVLYLFSCISQSNYWKVIAWTNLHFYGYNRFLCCKHIRNVL